MSIRRSQPFNGAVAASHEVLGCDFVQRHLERIAASPGVVLPSLDVATQGFELMGNRPEEILKALVQLQANHAAPPDQAFPIICATLSTAAADVELRALDDLGRLAQVMDAWIAACKEEGISSLFSADALADYAQRTGAAVETSQVQTLAAKIVASNLIARQGHGVYAVADPFVREVWMSRAVLESGALDRRQRAAPWGEHMLGRDRNSEAVPQQTTMSPRRARHSRANHTIIECPKAAARFNPSLRLPDHNNENGKGGVMAQFNTVYLLRHSLA